MKRLITSAIFIFIATFVFSASDGCRKKAKMNTKTEKAAKDFFTASLNKENRKFDNCGIIPLKSIEKMRGCVWTIWKNTVNEYKEEKLIGLGELEERNSSYWELPQELEPNATMPYYWGVNEKLDSEETTYPLFLYMHGSGDKRSEWETGIRLAMSKFHKPAAYFIPQIPNAYGELYRWAIPSKQWAWEKLLRLAFLNDSIDANRIYFFGISEGGYGSQRLASFYADYLAGAGPMAGGEPLKNAPLENVANIAFSLRTGSEDYAFCRNMLTSKALETADSLAKIHPGLFPHFIEVIPGYGHGIDYAPTTPWLSQFKRNPHPEYFHWEDFEMYGQHRKGFYNIRVNETSRENDSQRTCYDVNINDNVISIDVNNVTYTTTHKVGGIDMLFAKNYSKAQKGNITVYLNEQRFNLNNPVEVILNGKKIFSGIITPTLKAMIESCALFFDPERIFPASIDIDIEKGECNIDL